MEKLFGVIGDIAAIVGISVCLIAGIARIVGSHYLLGFETATLFIGGISIMVAACLAKLHSFGLQSRNS